MSVQLVRQTLDSIGDAEVDLVRDVYVRFFEKSPESQELFGPQSGHEKRLMVRMTMMTVYERLSGESQVASYTNGIGLEHDVLLVTGPMYKAFTEAMLEALAASLGALWTQEHARVWEAELRLLSDKMMNAAY